MALVEFPSQLRRATLLLVWMVATTARAQDNKFWQDSFRLNFNYDPTSNRGPQNWDAVNTRRSEWSTYENLGVTGNECGLERRPSPRELVPNNVCRDDREILTRQKSNSDCTRDDLTFEITPYTLRAYYPLDDSSCIRPTIEVDRLPDPFTLVWMELHVRAEHVVDGRRYDAELQMVHMGTGQDRDRIATVSVLLEADAREDHADFQFLLDGWQKVANDKDAACGEDTVRMLRRFSDNLSELTTEHENEKEPSVTSGTSRKTQACKPDRLGNGCEPLGPRDKMYPYNMWPSIWYYGYSGSLTTPPCSSINVWRVIDVPMSISRRQLKQLGQLLQSAKSSDCQDDSLVNPATGENYRPIQTVPANRQASSIFHCTIDNFSFDVFPPNSQ